LKNVPKMQDVGNGEMGWVFAGHNKDGELVVIPNQREDLEAAGQSLQYINGATKDVGWGNYTASVPDRGSWNTDIREVSFEDKSDTKAITELLQNTDNYIENTKINSVEYFASPDNTLSEDYNCNSWKNGNLKKAGATDFDCDFEGLDVGKKDLIPESKFDLGN